MAFLVAKIAYSCCKQKQHERTQIVSLAEFNS